MGMNNEQYRLLWSPISRSKKIKSVEGTKIFRLSCHLIYTWLLPWGDDDGRICGDLLWLYANIFPNEGLTEKEIATALEELQRVQLIYWYEIDNERFIQIIDWSSHQRIRKDRYKPSVYPSCPSSVRQVSVTPQPVVNHTGDGDGDKGGSGGNEKTLKRFAVFWEAYPKKKSKGQAETTFKKINPNEQLFATILTVIKQAKKSNDWLKDGGQYIPYPASWLNAKRWEDEYEPAKPQSRLIS